MLLFLLFRSPGVCLTQGVTITKPIVYGNVARYFGKKREEDGHTHHWTVYLKPYLNEVSKYLLYMLFGCISYFFLRLGHVCVCKESPVQASRKLCQFCQRFALLLHMIFLTGVSVLSNYLKICNELLFCSSFQASLRSERDRMGRIWSCYQDILSRRKWTPGVHSLTLIQILDYYSWLIT